MTGQRDPADVAIVILVLRTLRGWDQRAFAAAAGVSASSICRYEAGDIVPTPATWKRLLAAAGLPDLLVEGLLAWVRSARATIDGPQQSGERLLDSLCGEISNEITGIVRSSAALLLTGQPGMAAGPWGRALPPCEGDRQQAPMLWKALERLSERERRVLVEDSQEYRNWALSELLCAESVQAAADSAEWALDLAELAVLIAGLVPGEETWRWRLQGYAESHLGNSRRVGSDLRGAEEAFASAGSLWLAGAPGDPGLLSEALVLSLEASLRIDQCRLPEAAVLLERALAVWAPSALRTNLLIQRARLLEWAGDYEAALETLGHAATLISEPLEPRQRLMLRFNPAWNLCHLGKADQAAALLPELQTLTAQIGNHLDGLRLRWLEGRVATGLGQTAEALATLTEVRSRFAELDIAYDAALATLEVAVLHLEQGHTAEVKTLALEMAPIFQAQGVHREALAALRLFCEAAKQEAATVELARRLVDYLYRAQHDPQLRFEAAS